MSGILPANVISDALSGGPNLITRTLSGLGILPPSWGIFNQGGSAVVVADSVSGVEYRQDWQVSDYPQENGGFQSYDKVATPFDARVSFVSGGSLANRQQLLKSVSNIAGDLNLYDVVTPEATYLSCNVVHYEYRRTDGKAGLIEVRVHLLQIRVTGQGSLSAMQQSGASGTATPTVQNAADPSGNSTVNLGQVQATSPTTGQQIAVNSAITNKAIAAGA